jgi:hypothetical protein
MAQLIRAAPLSEPEVVHCVLVEGVGLEMRDEIVRLVGWVALEITDEAVPAERRIVVRVAMPLGTARKMVRELRHSLLSDRN